MNENWGFYSLNSWHISIKLGHKLVYYDLIDNNDYSYKLR